MKIHARSALWLALALCSLYALPAGAQTPSCESLINLQLRNVTISSAVPVAAGMFTPPDPVQRPAQVPDFCRVSGVISPVEGSAIGFEVWLPPADVWNQKLMMTGNSGLAGVISYTTPPANMADAVRRGYVAAGTDTGHMGGFTDASFALGAPEKVVDNAFRGVSETTRVAKEITLRFFGRSQERAYFNGCSSGGRQGLLAAQRFPEDFDGIIAGAPAAFITHIAAAGAFLAQQTIGDPTGATYIPAAKLPALAEAVLAACDAIDGLEDGLIEDPRRCTFNPRTLQCRGAGADRDDCLTAPQVGALINLYGGPRDTRDGSIIAPGLERGGELGGPLDWSVSVTGPAPGAAADIALSSGFLGQIGFMNPAFSPLTFQSADVDEIDRRVGDLYNAVDPNLNDFARRGGKLILFHGWSDSVIPPRATVEYFQSVMNRRAAGAVPAQEFVRLFMAPGMQHCVGGPGPFAFDAVRALERWVEEDVPPARLDASHLTPQGVIDRTRPLCPFPQVARLMPGGDPDSATSFRCQMPAADIGGLFGDARP